MGFNIIVLCKYQEKFTNSNPLDYHLKLRYPCLLTYRFLLNCSLTTFPLLYVWKVSEDQKTQVKFMPSLCSIPKHSSFSYFSCIPSYSKRNLCLSQKSVNLDPFIFPYLELPFLIESPFLFLLFHSSLLPTYETHILSIEADSVYIHIYVLMPPDPFLLLQSASFILWYSNRGVPLSLVWFILQITTVPLPIRTKLLSGTLTLFHYWNTNTV